MTQHKQFGVGLEPELNEMIRQEAARNNRSLGAEIRHRLWMSFADPGMRVMDEAMLRKSVNYVEAYRQQCPT